MLQRVSLIRAATVGSLSRMMLQDFLQESQVVPDRPAWPGRLDRWLPLVWGPRVILKLSLLFRSSSVSGPEGRGLHLSACVFLHTARREVCFSVSLLQWGYELGQASEVKVSVPLHGCEHFYLITKPLQEPFPPSTPGLACPFFYLSTDLESGAL